MNQDQIPRQWAIGFATLRVAIGMFLIFKGLDKLSWVLDASPLTAKLELWLQHASAANRWYLEMVLPGAPVFARLSALGELLGGAALVCGVRTSSVAVLALFMILNYHVATAEIFKLEFLTDGAGLPLLGGLAALALADTRRADTAPVAPAVPELA